MSDMSRWAKQTYKRLKLNICLSTVVHARKVVDGSRTSELVKLPIFRLLMGLGKGGTTARKNLLGYLQVN